MPTRTERSFETEVEFTLPRGYLDADSILHRQGVMRLATAADEILPLRDPRVQQNPAYLAIIVLARVIIKLGGLTDIDAKTIEGLFATDLDYLQRLYERINSIDENDAPEFSATTAPRTASLAAARGVRSSGEA